MKTLNLPLEVKKTKGNYIYLNDGRKLLDGISSWWSVAHGYNQRKLIKAAIKQLKIMPHVMFAGLANKPAYLLAEKLINFVNYRQKEKLAKVFYSDSGSTAVEVAMKISVQYFLNQDKLKKTKIIAFKDAYHGDTMGGMSLSDMEEGMHKKFKDFCPKQLVTKIPNDEKEFLQFEKFIKKNSDKAAAIIIEPLLQAAGGMKFHDAWQLEKIIKISRKNNILVIFDECATGFYRLGSRFAYHQLALAPDILTIGKAMTGGIMTMAATIVNQKIYQGFLSDSLDKALMHGPTFMGNPLAANVSLASIELFEQYDYQQKTKNIELIFAEKLKAFEDLALVKTTRFRGAVGVIEFNKIDQDLMFKLREEFVRKGVWLRPFANILYFMPPLTIKARELNRLIEVSYEIISKLK